MSFLSFLLYFRNISKITNTFFSMFLTSLFSPYFSFHSLFSFLFILLNVEETLTHTREHSGKASIASCPCGFDPFSLYAITEVSRKPKHTLLTIDFKMTLFVHDFSPIMGKQFQRPRNDPMASTYNPGCRNHPNLSWNQGACR